MGCLYQILVTQFLRFKHNLSLRGMHNNIGQYVRFRYFFTKISLQDFIKGALIDV